MEKETCKTDAAEEVRAIIKRNFELIKAIRTARDEIALMLGEIIGLTEYQKNSDDIRENIFEVAQKWMRQCNRLDKEKTNLKTIGKVLGIDGTPREVMDRLSLFKLCHSQYTIICELHASSCCLRALS